VIRAELAGRAKEELGQVSHGLKRVTLLLRLSNFGLQPAEFTHTTLVKQESFILDISSKHPSPQSTSPHAPFLGTSSIISNIPISSLCHVYYLRGIYINFHSVLFLRQTNISALNP
jgi:hypothetical protein